MFDIAWSELLILAVVTLIFVGPKELPRLMATVGRYVGIVQRQASEFRAIFDQAIREAELHDVKEEMTAIRDEIADVGRDAAVAADSPTKKTDNKQDAAETFAHSEQNSTKQALPPEAPRQQTPPSTDGGT